MLLCFFLMHVYEFEYKCVFFGYGNNDVQTSRSMKPESCFLSFLSLPVRLVPSLLIVLQVRSFKSGPAILDVVTVGPLKTFIGRLRVIVTYHVIHGGANHQD
uniref:Uncharacterized protein n=1 Tax=Ixodes ricinus TaxID=34613 RepID=A0A0K8R4Y4_IXORI